MPLQIGKTPIVVPRQHQFNEHVNDHQVEFARNVAQRMGTIIPVEDINTLGDIITNYDQIGKRNTVFHIHDCRGDYAYGASKGKGEVIKEEYFENCEWHIRALFEGEQRVEESQLKCEGVVQIQSDRG